TERFRDSPNCRSRRGLLHSAPARGGWHEPGERSDEEGEMSVLNRAPGRRQGMKHVRKAFAALIALTAGVAVAAGPAAAHKKPNIIFIMGDDIGWMQPSISHRGIRVGETPNIARIGNEGAIFMDYVAMQSCTSGRNVFFTGMSPLRTGMIPPQLPGS